MMKLKLTAFLLLFSAFGAYSFELQEDIENLPFRQKAAYGNKVFELGNYYEAVAVFKSALNQRENHAESMFLLAESWRLARDYEKAEEAYKNLLREHPERYPEAIFYYATVLKHNQKFAESKRQFNEFLQKSSGRQHEGLKKLAEMEIEASDFAMHAIQNPNEEIEVQHLGRRINSPQTDFSPFYLNGHLYYASYNIDSVRRGQFYRPGKYYSHIYRSSTGGDGNFTAPEIIQADINGVDFHSGNGSFSPDGNRFYFTNCQDYGNANIECKIYVSEFNNGNFTNVRALGNAVNRSGSNNTQPAVMPGENGKDILIFSSDRDGGFGGYDLWHVEVSRDGSTGRAVNLGEDINTPGDERTPFYNRHEGILYFSSNGHKGLGGLDIFKVKGNLSGWGEVINPGAPINSSADDMYFTIGEAQNIYYLVSNRPGNLGTRGKTCCDDIYRFVDVYIPEFTVSGSVYEEYKDGTTTGLNGVKVQIVDVTDEQNKLTVFEEVLTDENAFSFNDILFDKRYQILVSKDNYFTESHFLDTRNAEESEDFNLDFTLRKVLMGETYTLSNIYYDFGKATLRSESKETLDELYQLMVDNPSLIIELSSHTDHVGTHEYNMRLSQERAQACVDYLVSKGIPNERLKAKGYGKTRPIAPNLNPDGTQNPEGMQRNRRTEFEVIGDLKGAEVIFE